MKDWLEIQFWKVAKRLIERDYLPYCSDYAFKCPSCEAKEVADWIKEHIETLEYFR